VKVAARLGGFPGILGFLHNFVVVGEQAALVGVAGSDIAEVATVLESSRGGVRNK